MVIANNRGQLGTQIFWSTWVRKDSCTGHYRFMLHELCMGYFWEFQTLYLNVDQKYVLYQLKWTKKSSRKLEPTTSINFFLFKEFPAFEGPFSIHLNQWRSYVRKRIFDPRLSVWNSQRWIKNSLCMICAAGSIQYQNLYEFKWIKKICNF